MLSLQFDLKTGRLESCTLQKWLLKFWLSLSQDVELLISWCGLIQHKYGEWNQVSYSMRKRRTWIMYSWSTVLLGLYGFGQIRRLELSSFALALWSSGWLSWWKILIFKRRNMWCSIDCLILTLWTLWYNLNKVMFEGVQESVFEMLMLMLSEALFCRYTQAYDKQHVDQSNCRRVPRRVCLVVKGWHVLLTVERHRQRSCKWGCFAYKCWAGRIIFSACCSSAICKRVAAYCMRSIN